MEVQEMLELVIKTNDKINISPEQLKQLEVLVVAYMSATQLQQVDDKLSQQVISGLDIKWGSLFKVTKK